VVAADWGEDAGIVYESIQPACGSRGNDERATMRSIRHITGDGGDASQSRKFGASGFQRLSAASVNDQRPAALSQFTRKRPSKPREAP